MNDKTNSSFVIYTLTFIYLLITSLFALFIALGIAFGELNNNMFALGALIGWFCYLSVANIGRRKERDLTKLKDISSFHEKTERSTTQNEDKLQNNEIYSQEIIVLSNDLRVQFTELFNSTHYGQSARRSSEQLFRIIDKFDKFKDILDSKLEKTEMTYDRFLGATEEVYLNILDNLEKIKNVYRAVEDIDLDYIENRIESIKNATSMTKEMQDELSSLRYRKSMSKKQLESIEKLLSVNEQAITDIDNMRIKVGNLNTSSNRSQYDIDTSIADLKKMAERVHKYSSDYSQ